MQQKAPFDKTVKYLLIGDSGVGKSTLRLALNEKVEPDIKPTIGMDFETRIIKYHDMGIKIQIWDTAGALRFRALTSARYRGADILFCVINLSDHLHFNNIPYWLKLCDEHASERTIRILVGNIPNDPNLRVVPYNDIKALADENKITYLEVNALNFESVWQMYISGLDEFAKKYDLIPPTLPLNFCAQ